MSSQPANILLHGHWIFDPAEKANPPRVSSQCCTFIAPGSKTKTKLVYWLQKLHSTISSLGPTKPTHLGEQPANILSHRQWIFDSVQKINPGLTSWHCKFIVLGSNLQNKKTIRSTSYTSHIPQFHPQGRKNSMGEQPHPKFYCMGQQNKNSWSESNSHIPSSNSYPQCKKSPVPVSPSGKCQFSHNFGAEPWNWFTHATKSC
jgi:hypothetical protein